MNSKVNIHNRFLYSDLTILTPILYCTYLALVDGIVPGRAKLETKILQQKFYYINSIQWYIHQISHTSLIINPLSSCSDKL